ncbi:MAG TPA: hypothetical protein VFN09_10635, partial [Rhodanobacteraceae bacterium]|nr:hypothetical protein [Rhodanobacteraceae bacterium]
MPCRRCQRVVTPGSTRARGRDIAADEVLARYARRRESADRLDARGFDALARLYANQYPPLAALRGLGLNLVNRFGPLKRHLAAHAAGD